MSITSKNVFLVKCDLLLFSDTFSKKKNSDVINQHDIRQKLTNNDVFKIPPTEDIVNFQIIKKLSNFKICNKTEFLFIYQEEIKTKFIDQLKEFFSDSNYPINYHLLLDEEIKLKKIKNLVNSIQFIDDNWV